MVSCFLAPSTDARYTSPASVSDELAELTGGYVLDVADFRTEDKARVAQQVFDMTEQRFTVAKHTGEALEFLAIEELNHSPVRWQALVTFIPMNG